MVHIHTHTWSQMWLNARLNKHQIKFIPVSWAKPTVCPAVVQLAHQHRERLTGTWCLPAPGACLWVACGGLWVDGGGTEPQYSPSSLAQSGWGWPCQSWCCWGSVSLPVYTALQKYYKTTLTRTANKTNTTKRHCYNKQSWNSRILQALFGLGYLLRKVRLINHKSLFM